ncbi:MAG: hypothetical protein AB2672_20520 [Candidatus Thiodiazotropha endolucinida]|nr:MAG: hypothetical protein DBP02_16645 [gamma proteobacterium symbiont of Ctena orbiculata]
MPIPTLSTVKQFSAKYPAWSEASVRWNVFNAEKNGLAEAGAIIRDGGKVLINEEKWFEVKLNFRESRS